MTSIARRRILALALFIIFSQTLLLVHAVAHIDKGSVQCQLCLSQAQQSHGLPLPGFHFNIIHEPELQPERLISTITAGTRIRPYFQRAPPVIS